MKGLESVKLKLQKFAAWILVIALLCTTVGISAAAQSGTPAVSAQSVESPSASAADKRLWNAVNGFATALLRTICFVFPNPRWRSADAYSAQDVGILPGRSTFRTAPEKGAVWSLGYDRQSIIPDDFESGKYYMGRKLNVVSFQSDAKAQDVLDDQFVRAVCVQDGAADGAVAIAVVDGIGVTSRDIRQIRKDVIAALGADAIASINISATHCHSAIDTQGVSSSFLQHMLLAPVCNLLDTDIPGTENDRHFKAVLRAQTVKAICNAYNTMTRGNFYYTTLDGSDYIRDKKAPYVPECTRIASLRFVPADTSVRTTYLINMTAHPTSFSYRNTSVSSDYPYYMDMEFNARGFNFILLTGAIGQIGRKTDLIEDAKPAGETDPHYVVKQYGKALADLILRHTGQNEETLPPMLNAMHSDFFITCTNYLLVLAVKCRLVDNEVFRVGANPNGHVLPSEVGYIELGGRVAFALYGAELYPEVYWGTAFGADEAWDGTDWAYAGSGCMAGMHRPGVDMYPLCFANDYIGYVVPDNDFAFIAHEPDELLSAGKHTATMIVQAFIDLMDQVNAAAGA